MVLNVFSLPRVKECVTHYAESNQWIQESVHTVHMIRTYTAFVSISIWCCIYGWNWLKSKHLYPSHTNVNWSFVLLYILLWARGWFCFDGNESYRIIILRHIHMQTHSLTYVLFHSCSYYYYYYCYQMIPRTQNMLNLNNLF